MKLALYDQVTIADEHELGSIKAFLPDGAYLLHAVTRNKQHLQYLHLHTVRTLFEKQFHVGKNTCNSIIQCL